MWNYQGGVENVKTFKCFLQCSEGGNRVDHFEEEENFPLEAKQARICFAGWRNVAPSISVGTVITAATGLGEQAPATSGFVSCV